MKTEEKIDLVLELLKEFKKDVNRRFDDVDRRFEEQGRRIGRLEDGQKEDHHLLMDIWKSREKVLAKVTWDFVWKATSFNAVLLVFMFLMLKVA